MNIQRYQALLRMGRNLARRKKGLITLIRAIAYKIYQEFSGWWPTNLKTLWVRSSLDYEPLSSRVSLDPPKLPGYLSQTVTRTQNIVMRVHLYKSEFSQVSKVTTHKYRKLKYE